MKKYFPLSAAGQKSVTHLIVALVAYLVIGWLIGPIIGKLTGWIPLIGGILKFLMWLVYVYCVCGIIVALLLFFKVIK